MATAFMITRYVTQIDHKQVHGKRLLPREALYACTNASYAKDYVRSWPKETCSEDYNNNHTL